LCVCVNVRCNQTEYRLDKELNDLLKEKQVRCPTDGCSYKAPLCVYLLHSHGRKNHSNADVDFRRIEAEHRRFIPLPSLAALEADSVAAGAMDMRDQLMHVRFHLFSSSIICSMNITAVVRCIHIAPNELNAI